MRGLRRMTKSRATRPCRGGPFMSKPTCWKTRGCSGTSAFLHWEDSEIDDDRHHEDQRRATKRTAGTAGNSERDAGHYRALSREAPSARFPRKDRSPGVSDDSAHPRCRVPQVTTRNGKQFLEVTRTDMKPLEK